MNTRDPRYRKLLEMLLTFYRQGDGREPRIRRMWAERIMALFVEVEDE
jgi:hypothetical protein